MLREGIAIATLRYRHDIKGINRERFHRRLIREGKLRGGLEFLTAKPKLWAPWEEAKNFGLQTLN